MNQDNPFNPSLDVSVFKLPVSTEQIFGNSNRSAIEIGFGEGEFLVEIAKDNPGWNYLGIEIKYFRYKKAIALARKENVRNIKFLHFDADLGPHQNECQTAYATCSTFILMRAKVCRKTSQAAKASSMLRRH